MEFDELLIALDLVYPECLKEFAPTCCVVASRTAMLVSKHFGFKSWCVAARTWVFNPVISNLSDEELKRLSRMSREELSASGGWIVAIDSDPSHVDWRGEAPHVVTIVEHESQPWLVDCSLAQATRPHKEIFMPRSLAIRVSDEQLAGQTITITDVERSTVYYKLSKSRRFKDSPDWTIKSRAEAVALRVVRSISQHEALQR